MVFRLLSQHQLCSALLRRLILKDIYWQLVCLVITFFLVLFVFIFIFICKRTELRKLSGVDTTQIKASDAGAVLADALRRFLENLG